MPCTEIGEVGFYLSGGICQFCLLSPLHWRAGKHITAVIPSMKIARICIKHPLYYEELLVPVCPSPPIRIVFSGSNRYILEAPSTVVPYPIYLRMLLKVSRRK